MWLWVYMEASAPWPLEAGWTRTRQAQCQVCGLYHPGSNSDVGSLRELWLFLCLRTPCEEAGMNAVACLPSVAWWMASCGLQALSAPGSSAHEPGQQPFFQTSLCQGQAGLATDVSCSSRALSLSRPTAISELHFVPELGPASGF